MILKAACFKFTKCYAANANVTMLIQELIQNIFLYYNYVFLICIYMYSINGTEISKYIMIKKRSESIFFHFIFIHI